MAAVENLRALRRLVAAHAVLSAVDWAAALAERGASSAAALLREVDEPGVAWRAATDMLVGWW